MNIEQIINNIHTLPQASQLKLIGIIKLLEFSKGTLIFNEGRIERNLYFVKSGIVRAYSHQHDVEVTFWFGQEGDPVLSMKSYIDNQPGYETIQLLEKCQLYQIKTQQLKVLYEEDIHLANWGRRLVERELIKTEERLIFREFKTALQRYQELIEHHPKLLQRVPLGYIASYLGITQVSLSRIRTQIS